MLTQKYTDFKTTFQDDLISTVEKCGAIHTYEYRDCEWCMK